MSPVHTDTHALSRSNIELRKRACLALYKAGDLNVLIQPFLVMKRHEDYILLLKSKNVRLDFIYILLSSFCLCFLLEVAP